MKQPPSGLKSPVIRSDKIYISLKTRLLYKGQGLSKESIQQTIKPFEQQRSLQLINLALHQIQLHTSTPPIVKSNNGWE